jgi:endo-beta-N-acetylglucosaminidase D
VIFLFKYSLTGPFERDILVKLSKIEVKTMAAPKKKPQGLTYKGYPLRRKDSLVYYGSMAQKYIVMLQILDTADKNGVAVPTRVSLQLQLTDPDLKSRDRVLKKSEKGGLYSAIDVGAIWLERALGGK